MSNRDLIVGCATNYDWSKLKYWVNSINESGFEGDKVLILMNCDKDTVKKISDSGFSIIAFNQDSNGNLTYESQMMVHVERFFHIYQLLKDNEYRYVITTDVKDVIFQRNPSKWLEENLPEGVEDLVFSSESMKYKDEPWGNQNLLETFGPQIYEDFKDHTIFNVGVLAGHGYAMKDLMMNIFASCMHRPIKICDQSTFNFLISQHPYLSTSMYTRSEDGWACQLGTTADPSKIEQFRPFLLEPSPKMEGDKVLTSEGIEYIIVHQYDRVPEWKKVIEAKYDDK
jgi:hypothetical protein